MANKPYTFETAAGASLSIVVQALRGQPLDVDTILRAEIALEKAVNERLNDCEADFTITQLNGRNIKITGYNKNTGDDPEDRSDSYYAELEV